jgi:hypothetical protein
MTGDSGEHHDVPTRGSATRHLARRVHTFEVSIGQLSAGIPDRPTRSMPLQRVVGVLERSADLADLLAQRDELKGRLTHAAVECE